MRVIGRITGCYTYATSQLPDRLSHESSSRVAEKLTLYRFLVGFGGSQNIEHEKPKPILLTSKIFQTADSNLSWSRLLAEVDASGGACLGSRTMRTRRVECTQMVQAIHPRDIRAVAPCDLIAVTMIAIHGKLPSKTNHDGWIKQETRHRLVYIGWIWCK